MNKLRSVVAAILVAGGGVLLAADTASADPRNLGSHSGCSALEDETAPPRVGDFFGMTIGARALNSADSDGDGTPDSVEQCICDALAVAGFICDPPAPSSDFAVECTTTSTGPGQKVTRTCAFTAVGSICPSCTFAFSRTVNTISHMTSQVAFDKGCTATDPYGSNHCTWTLGEQVTEAHQGVLQEDITAGKLVVDLTLTDTIHGMTPFAFACPICGGDCTIVNPFSAASETFAMPACPIQATTIPSTQTPFTVPRNPREAIPAAVPVVLRSAIEHVFGELGVPFGDLSVPSSVAGTVQIADQSGAVIFKVTIEAEWQP